MAMNASEAKVPHDDGNWQSIEIFLFSNGQQYSPPRKYHLQAEELNWWDATLNYLAKSHYGIQHPSIYLYTTDGHLVEGPLELRDGMAYVAVEPSQKFIDAGYEKYLIRASRSWEKRQARKKNKVCDHEQPCCICPEKERAESPPSTDTPTGPFKSYVLTKSGVAEILVDEYDAKQRGRKLKCSRQGGIDKRNDDDGAQPVVQSFRPDEQKAGTFAYKNEPDTEYDDRPNKDEPWPSDVGPRMEENLDKSGESEASLNDTVRTGEDTARLDEYGPKYETIPTKDDGRRDERESWPKEYGPKTGEHDRNFSKYGTNTDEPRNRSEKTGTKAGAKRKRSDEFGQRSGNHQTGPVSNGTKIDPHRPNTSMLAEHGGPNEYETKSGAHRKRSTDSEHIPAVGPNEYVTRPGEHRKRSIDHEHEPAVGPNGYATRPDEHRKIPIDYEHFPAVGPNEYETRPDEHRKRSIDSEHKPAVGPNGYATQPDEHRKISIDSEHIPAGGPNGYATQPDEHRKRSIDHEHVPAVGPNGYATRPEEHRKRSIDSEHVPAVGPNGYATRPGEHRKRSIDHEHVPAVGPNGYATRPDEHRKISIDYEHIPPVGQNEYETRPSEDRKRSIDYEDTPTDNMVILSDEEVRENELRNRGYDVKEREAVPEVANRRGNGNVLPNYGARSTEKRDGEIDKTVKTEDRGARRGGASARGVEQKRQNEKNDRGNKSSENSRKENEHGARASDQRGKGNEHAELGGKRGEHRGKRSEIGAKARDPASKAGDIGTRPGDVGHRVGDIKTKGSEREATPKSPNSRTGEHGTRATAPGVRVGTPGARASSGSRASPAARTTATRGKIADNGVRIGESGTRDGNMGVRPANIGARVDEPRARQGGGGSRPNDIGVRADEHRARGGGAGPRPNGIGDLVGQPRPRGNSGGSRAGDTEDIIGEPRTRRGSGGSRVNDIGDIAGEPRSRGGGGGSRPNDNRDVVGELGIRGASGVNGAAGFPYISEAQQHVRRSSLSSGKPSAEKKRWSAGQHSTTLKRPSPYPISPTTQKKIDGTKAIKNQDSSPEKFFGKDPPRVEDEADTSKDIEKSKTAPNYTYKRFAPPAVPPPTTSFNHSTVRRRSTSLTKITSIHKSMATDSAPIENIIGDKEIIVVSTDLYRTPESEITSTRLDSIKQVTEVMRDSSDETQTEQISRKASIVSVTINEEVQTYTEQHEEEQRKRGTWSHCKPRVTRTCSEPQDDLVVTDDPEDNYISIINKGDVVNLKLNIEVRNGGRLERCDGCDSNQKNCRKSRSLTNITRTEKCSQVSIDEDFCVQSKSLQSLLNNECFRGSGFEGRPKVVVVQCACCGQRPNNLRCDQPLCIDSKKYIVLLPNSQQDDSDDRCYCEPACQSYSQRNTQPKRHNNCVPVRNTISNVSLETVSVSEVPMQRRDMGMFIRTTNSTCQTDDQKSECLVTKHKVSITEEPSLKCNFQGASLSQMSMSTQAQLIATKKSCPRMGTQVCSQVDQQLGSQVSSQVCLQVGPQLQPGYSRVPPQAFPHGQSHRCPQECALISSQVYSQVQSQKNPQISQVQVTQVQSQGYSQDCPQMCPQVQSQRNPQVSLQVQSQAYSQDCPQVCPQQGQSQRNPQVSLQVQSQAYSQDCPQICPQQISQVQSQRNPQVFQAQGYSQECPQICPQPVPRVQSQRNPQVSLQVQTQPCSQDCPQICAQVSDSQTQTQWCSVLLEARRHEDGRYSFHLPPLHVLRYYTL